MRLYEVYMEHTMRSVVEVAAESVEDAKVRAYHKSFDEDYGWEEMDTVYTGVDELREITDEEAEEY